MAAKVAAGIQVGKLRTARRFSARCPAEVCLPVGIQLRAPAGVAGVEEEVFEIDRNKLARVAQLVAVRAACHLTVVLLALATAADVLRPAGQVEQARVIAEREASRGLPAALSRQAD